MSFAEFTLRLLPPMLENRILRTLLHAVIIPLHRACKHFSTCHQTMSKRLSIATRAVDVRGMLGSAFFLASKRVCLITPRGRGGIIYFFGDRGERALAVCVRKSKSDANFRCGHRAVKCPIFVICIPAFLYASLIPRRSGCHKRRLRAVGGLLSCCGPTKHACHVVLCSCRWRAF